MKKGIFILTLLILALFSVSCIYAADVNDTIVASEDNQLTDESIQSSEIQEIDNDEVALSEGDSSEDSGKIAINNENEKLEKTVTTPTFEAIADAIENDCTIYLAPGVYTGDTDIFIREKSNVTIIGNSTILDAQGQKRIFKFESSSNITIQNITFKNGYKNYGGAIEFSMSDNCSVSDCIFINNTANFDGGAINWFEFSDNGRVSDCIFINNTANRDGGAIDWFDSGNGRVSDCIFINNTANRDGGAIYAGSCDLNADYNWFGNNVTNYNDPLPINYGVHCDYRLFLNATADPDTIYISDTSNIIFKLYQYHSGNITEYDNAPFQNINLTIIVTNGNVSENITKLGEAITFTGTSIGTGSITATIENIAYTTTLTVTTDGTTFWDLDQTINGNANDTITLDRDYAYNPASDSDFIFGVEINRPVTINGNGHTIDAKGQAAILWVIGDNVTINNVTFVNGKYDGYGGAIYWSGANGTVSGSSFTGNNATWNGGAIYWYGANGTVSGSCFTGNNATEDGGAIYWGAANGNVSNSIFINNAANIEGDAIYGNRYLIADYCWFGGNATNYKDDLPIAQAAYCNYILFLNVTANPNEVPAFNTSEIVFKLYLYNKTSTTGDISEYDNTRLLPINLTITSTNGDVDIHTVNLGESIRYTPTGLGDASVTATIENVAWTIELNNIKANPNLSAENQVQTNQALVQ